MSTELKITSLLGEALKSFYFSGYQLYAERRGVATNLAGGKTAHWGNVEDVTPDTYFDLGSLTKIILTTSCLARAVDRKALDLESVLADFVPEFKDTGYAKLKVIDLLAHASGLKGWMPLYETLGKQSLTEWLLSNGKTTFETTPRKKVIYSDLGFLCLGKVIERIWGDIDKAFAKEVVKPLGLEGVQFLPLKKGESVAATEYCLVRKRLLHGEVFDENTFALKGKASHAGLFGRAQAIATWCREWLLAVQGKSDWLGEDTAHRFTSRSELISGSTWALGFDTKSKAFSSAGELFSMKSFGWLGFPGCSIWIDPVAEGFAVFLTNRIHPSRFDDRIRKLRPLLHDEIARMWNG